jgi:hypothetical protein
MILSNKNFWGGVVLVLIVGCLVGVPITRRKNLEYAKEQHFKGVVEKIHYNTQGYPTITLNGKKHDLINMKWHRDFIIHTDDTIIKIKGDSRIKLLKPNSRDTIYFNDYE